MEAFFRDSRFSFNCQLPNRAKSLFYSFLRCEVSTKLNIAAMEMLVKIQNIICYPFFGHYPMLNASNHFLRICLQSRIYLWKLPKSYFELYLVLLLQYGLWDLMLANPSVGFSYSFWHLLQILTNCFYYKKSVIYI